MPGVRVTELLPTVAKQMKHLAVVRSMTTKEGDHGRATYQLRTGYAQQEPLQYPTLGSLVSKELGDPKAELPAFVSIASRRGLNDGGFGAGYLGANYAPLLIGNSDNDPYVPTPTEKALAVPDLKPGAGVSASQADTRLRLLGEQNAGFAKAYSSSAVKRRGRGVRPRPAADEQFGEDGVRPGRRAAGSPRRIRADAVRAGVSARPAAGRARRAVR